jgi:hypothetical protein
MEVPGPTRNQSAVDFFEMPDSGWYCLEINVPKNLSQGE